MSGRIVVGVDGSPAARAALEFATVEAQLRGWTLEVVHAAFARHPFLEMYPEMERAEEGVLEAAVTAARHLAPEVDVIASLYEPPAASGLLKASEGADLLVVGSRGLGGVRGALLGSVSTECVHHAPCAVVVVRAPRAGDDAGTAGHAASVEV